jgi:hypothetical protein
MTAMTITARCYCGHVQMRSELAPVTVAFCHCIDCKRWTGSPAPAFAAFDVGAVKATPDLGAPVVTNAGVERWNCPKCGSPLGATFDYLPDQFYVPLGLIDQADALPAAIHCHSAQQLPWLHIHDNADRAARSARDTLKVSKT